MPYDTFLNRVTARSRIVARSGMSPTYQNTIDTVA